MKSFLLKILTIVFALTLSFGVFTACGETGETPENPESPSAPTHTHDYKMLKYDSENHWFECDCGEKQNAEKHKGGTATETQKAVCDVCSQTYGEFLEPSHTHAYNTLKYDSENHWYECECGEKYGIESHNGGTATETEQATCDVCGAKYGSLLLHTHNFNQTITSIDYLLEKPNCQSKAIYYYSCVCGEKGDTTFEYGDIGTHTLKNGKCTACQETVFTTDGTYIYFGKYPQTIKSASVTIESDVPNDNGYYLGSDGEEYAKVSGFPFVLETNKKVFKFSNDVDIVKGTTYYFKVEPIKWRVLKVNNGQALLMSDVAIERNRYAGIENNYKNSDIRAYLNDTFLTNAFKDIESSIINTTLVDNSASTTAYNVNDCACENTQDKVFLLSYKDVTNASYGFKDKASREVSTSDYIRAKGVNLYPYNNYGTYNAHWITRSPENYSDGVSMVQADGSVNRVHVSDYGVSIVPAIQINLGDIDLEINKPEGDNGGNSIYTREGDYIYMGRYPQTLKADGVTVSTSINSNGYYLGSDGYEYAMSPSFAYESGYKFTNGTPILNNVDYYFKVEPIKWRILKEENGEALLIADSILMASKFDQRTATNYKISTLRAKLSTYYSTFFTLEEQQIILSTTVDNGVASTGYTENSNTCENTEDKLFLLSYLEATTSSFCFTASGEDVLRKKIATDYARVGGVRIDTRSDYYGYGDWWLRSMSNATTFGIRIVKYYGGFDYGNCYEVGGVVPAMRIKL